MIENFTGYLGSDTNSELRCAKKDYYADKFTNQHLNPKASWKTINNILGRGKKQDMIREIILPRKTVTLTSELVDVFNEHFTNIRPNLVKTIANETDGGFQNYTTRQDSNFSFQLVNVPMVYNLINNLSRFSTCQWILTNFLQIGKQQELYLCLRKVSGLC